jgi:hypothetical protein
MKVAIDLFRESRSNWGGVREDMMVVKTVIKPTTKRYTEITAVPITARVKSHLPENVIVLIVVDPGVYGWQVSLVSSLSCPEVIHIAYLRIGIKNGAIAIRSRSNTAITGK